MKLVFIEQSKMKEFMEGPERQKTFDHFRRLVQLNKALKLYVDSAPERTMIGLFDQAWIDGLVNKLGKYPMQGIVRANDGVEGFDVAYLEKFEMERINSIHAQLMEAGK